MVAVDFSVGQLALMEKESRADMEFGSGMSASALNRKCFLHVEEYRLDAFGFVEDPELESEDFVNKVNWLSVGPKDFSVDQVKYIGQSRWRASFSACSCACVKWCKIRQPSLGTLMSAVLDFSENGERFCARARRGRGAITDLRGPLLLLPDGQYGNTPGLRRGSIPY